MSTPAPRPAPERFILTLSCPDRRGIVAAVTGFLAEHHANLVDAAHFNDEHTRRSFVRALFHDDGGGMPAREALMERFAPSPNDFGWNGRSTRNPTACAP